MAYRLKRDESVPDGIRRIAGEEVERAADQLSGKGDENRDEAIHEARKSVKKVRGILRLVRFELGGAFRVENARFRAVGRKLSAFRDAGALIETYNHLKSKYEEDWDQQGLASVLQGLVTRKSEAESLMDIEKTLGEVSAELRLAGKKVKEWPLKTTGFAAIKPGLKETFREGRKALGQAMAQPKPENFHEWRKRVKDHWYHMRLVEGLWTAVMQSYERSLKDLETWLGDDHNLTVLRDKIAAEPAFYGKHTAVQAFLSHVDQYQAELRANSLSLGDQIYAEKPRLFAQRLRHLYEAWKTQPETPETHDRLAV